MCEDIETNFPHSEGVEEKFCYISKCKFANEVHVKIEGLILFLYNFAKHRSKLFFVFR